MEPVGSTYGSQLISRVSAGQAPAPAADRSSDTGAAVSQAPRDTASGIPSSTAGRQDGFQPTGAVPEEFKPYSNGTSRNSPKGGGADVSAGSSAAEQDPQVQAEIDRLKVIEEKVKAHEAAHKSAGGTMTGPVSYTYTRGPDGKNYITGGEVPISVSPGKTPQETVARMEQVIRAALAPADPSPQDRAIAAQAATQQQEARQELAAAPAQDLPGAEAPVTDASQRSADKTVTRDVQRTYGVPVEPGRQSESGARTTISRTDPQSSDYPGRGSDRAPMTAATITGFGEQTPVSYYA